MLSEKECAIATLMLSKRAMKQGKLIEANEMVTSNGWVLSITIIDLETQGRLNCQYALKEGEHSIREAYKRVKCAVARSQIWREMTKYVLESVENCIKEDYKGREDRMKLTEDDKKRLERKILQELERMDRVYTLEHMGNEGISITEVAALSEERSMPEEEIRKMLGEAK